MMKRLTLLLISCLLAMISYAQATHLIDSTNTTENARNNGFEVELEYEYQQEGESNTANTKQGYDTITFADILFNFDTDYNLPCDTLAKWISIDATRGEGTPIIYDCSWWYAFRNGWYEPFPKTQLLFILRLKEWRRTHKVDESRIKHRSGNRSSYKNKSQN